MGKKDKGIAVTVFQLKFMYKNFWYWWIKVGLWGPGLPIPGLPYPDW